MKSQENQKAIQTQNENQELLYQERIRSIEGPIPDPILLEGYKKVQADFPERIFKMAENNNDANLEIAEAETAEKRAFNKRGQLFTFLIVLLGFGLAAAFEFLKDDTGAAITALICGIVPPGIAGINNLLNNKKDK